MLGKGHLDKSMNKKSGQFLKTGSLMAMVSLAQSILALIGLILLTRWINPNHFGEYAIGLTSLGILQVIRQFGVVQFAIHKPSLTNDDITELSRRVILVTLVLVGFIFFLLSLGVFNTLRDSFPLYFETIGIWLLILVLGNIASFNEALMLRGYDFFEVSKNNFIAFFLGNFLTPILMSKFFGFGYGALVTGYLVNEVLRAALMRNAINIKEVFCQKSTKVSGVKRFTVGFTVAKFGNYFALNSDNIIIGSIMGPATLGLYSRAYQLVLAPVNLIYGVLDKLYFSILSRKQDDLKCIREIYLESISIVFSLISPLVIALFMLSSEIIEFLFNDEWSELSVAFGIMIITVPFRLAYRINDSVLRALGKVNRRAVIQWVYAGFVVLAAYYSAFIDLKAVAVAISSVVVLNYVMLSFLINKVLSISISKLLYWSFVPAVFLLSTIALIMCFGYLFFVGFDELAYALLAAIFTILGLILLLSSNPAFKIFSAVLDRLVRG